MSKEKSGFNQVEYNNKYKKENYSRIVCEARKDIIIKIKNYCNDFELSVSQFVQMCCAYCIDNVHIDELKLYKSDKK